MTRGTCEILCREVMNTGRIPAGNTKGRQLVPPTKQVLAFLWSMANQEPTRLVADTCKTAQKITKKGLETERFSQMVREFPDFRSERKKWTTSGGCPQFPKRFSGKLPFHLTSNRNFRIFWLNGKHPMTLNLLLLFFFYSLIFNSSS